MERKLFNELKKQCKEVRKKYKNNPWDYYNEKIDYVNRITNPKDSYILINMFDWDNQRELWNRLSDDCKKRYKDEFLFF